VGIALGVTYITVLIDGVVGAAEDHSLGDPRLLQNSRAALPAGPVWRPRNAPKPTSRRPFLLVLRCGTDGLDAGCADEVEDLPCVVEIG
jgi:hypothetical protein